MGDISGGWRLPFTETVTNENKLFRRIPGNAGVKVLLSVPLIKSMNSGKLLPGLQAVTIPPELLEKHYKGMQDMEFTVEKGQQTRNVVNRTALPALHGNHR